MADEPPTMLETDDEADLKRQPTRPALHLLHGLARPGPAPGAPRCPRGRD